MRAIVAKTQPKPTILDESDLGLSPDDIAALLIAEEEFDQGTEQWHEQRNGKATASMFKIIVARDRYGKPYKGYYDYMLELVTERLTGKEKRFSSKPMQWGTNHEAEAVALYEEIRTEADVRECGFVEHPTLAAGASTDRLIDEDGTMEVKAPNTTTFIKYYLSHIPDDSPDVDVRKAANVRPDDWKFYTEQIQGQLWILKRKWNDHVVFDPDMPENSRITITRIERDDEYIDKILEPRVTEFLGKVDLIERYMLAQESQI
jgi:hypothetical protein